MDTNNDNPLDVLVGLPLSSVEFELELMLRSRVVTCDAVHRLIR